MGPVVKIVTNIVAAFVTGFGTGYAAGLGWKGSVSAGIGAVVAILAGLFQQKP